MTCVDTQKGLLIKPLWVPTVPFRDTIGIVSIRYYHRWYSVALSRYGHGFVVRSPPVFPRHFLHKVPIMGLFTRRRLKACFVVRCQFRRREHSRRR